MRFERLAIPGAMLVSPERREDERGFFARTWCRSELAAHGLVTHVEQCSVVFNRRRGTLRGLHYQAAPHQETKLVTCTRGSVYQVLLDLRPGDGFGRWISLVLRADEGCSVYVPAGVAHGYQTLEDSTELRYQMDVPYAPSLARGVRWDDPAFGIEWPPTEHRIMSDRDRSFPDWQAS